jgi:hypothetical protein
LKRKWEISLKCDVVQFRRNSWKFRRTFCLHLQCTSDRSHAEKSPWDVTLSQRWLRRMSSGMWRHLNEGSTFPRKHRTFLPDYTVPYPTS